MVLEHMSNRRTQSSHRVSIFGFALLGVLFATLSLPVRTSAQSPASVKKSKDGVLVKVPTKADNSISTTVVREIKVASTSNTHHNETAQYGPQFAFDGNIDTRWATDDSTS